MCHVATTAIQRYREVHECLSSYRLTVLANHYSFFPRDTQLFFWTNFYFQTFCFLNRLFQLHPPVHCCTDLLFDNSLLCPAMLKKETRSRHSFMQRLCRFKILCCRVSSSSSSLTCHKFNTNPLVFIAFASEVKLAESRSLVKWCNLAYDDTSCTCEEILFFPFSDKRSALSGYFSLLSCTNLSVSVCLSIYLSICLSVYPPTYLPSYLPIYLSILLSVCLSIALQSFVGRWPLFQFLNPVHCR
jgi:hypothetical protein